MSRAPRARFRFPYPPITSFALVAVVGFAFYQTVTTRNLIHQLGGEGAGDTELMMWSMYGLTLVLTLFVVGVIFYRSSLTLELQEDALTLRRLHLRDRVVSVSWDQVRRVSIRSDARKTFKVRVDAPGNWVKLTLSDALEGESGKRVLVKSRDDAERHPLTVALKERLGERLEVVGRSQRV